MMASPITYRRATASMLAASWVLAGGAVTFLALIGGRSQSDDALWKTWGELSLWLLWMTTAGVLGVLVAVRRPENRLGWVFAAGALAGTLAAFGDRYGVYALTTGDVPGASAAVFLGYPGLYASWLLLGVFVPLLFPVGRLRSRRTLAVIWLGSISAIAWSLEIFRPNLFTERYFEIPGFDNPLAIPGADGILRSVSDIAVFGLFLAMFLAIGSLAVRVFTSKGEERQQLKVIAYTVVVATVVNLVGANVRDFLSGTPALSILDFAMNATLVVIPVSFGVSILRFRLYDIDVVIQKTVVYGILAAFVSVVYVAVVVGIGTAIGSGDEPNLALSVAATAVVAVAFQPVRQRVTRLANRLVYGARATPYEVMSGFSKRVADVLQVDEVLPRMAEAAARGVGASCGRVEVFLHDGQRRSATWPEDAIVDRFDRTISVTHLGEEVGQLAVRKPPSEQLTPAEERLLSDLAGQAGIALRNAQLAAELQARLGQISLQADELRRSRERIVEAQDEERRRVERDLHDGAQQRLVGLALKLRMAQNRLGPVGNPDLEEILVSASDEVKQAHIELRELARGIHPAVLTDAGLGAAIEALAERAPLPVDVDVCPGRFPQRIEAALYFLVSEALVNISKYSEATAATIRVAREANDLIIEVTDNGRGGADAATGSGLRGLIDRISVLNGTLEIESPPGAGTRVRAEIPCG